MYDCAFASVAQSRVAQTNQIFSVWLIPYGLRPPRTGTLGQFAPSLENDSDLPVEHS